MELVAAADVSVTVDRQRQYRHHAQKTNITVSMTSCIRHAVSIFEAMFSIHNMASLFL